MRVTLPHTLRPIAIDILLLRHACRRFRHAIPRQHTTSYAALIRHATCLFASCHADVTAYHADMPLA